MKKSFNKAHALHSLYEEMNEIKGSLDVHNTPDRQREFLNVFFESVIGHDAMPEDMVSKLNSLMEELFLVLDWAWLEYYGILEKHKKKSSKKVDPNAPLIIDVTIDFRTGHLEHYKWIKERRARYKGHINFLTQEEVESPTKVFSTFYKYRNITDWKQILERWVTYAIDDKTNIVDDHFSPAYITYMDFVQLQKLIEYYWVKHEQETNTWPRGQKPWPTIKGNYPIFSTIDFVSNPFSEIRDMFQGTSLKKYKKLLNQWFKAVIDPRNTWKGAPAELLDFYKKIGVMIECCWIIKELGTYCPENWNDAPSPSKNTTSKDVGENYPFKIKELWDKPEDFLAKFYSRRNIEGYFRLMYNCLYHAFSKKHQDLYSDEEIIDFKNDLTLLVEAAYLIQKRKYTPKPKI